MAQDSSTPFSTPPLAALVRLMGQPVGSSFMRGTRSDASGEMGEMIQEVHRHNATSLEMARLATGVVFDVHLSRRAANIMRRANF